MKMTPMWAVAAAVMLGVAGCNKAESPAKVDSDVAKAADTAAVNDVKANENEAKTNAAADKEVAREQDKADSKTADAAADTTITQAEGDNKVALAKCEALSGDAQKSCKDQANAVLDEAKARARAMKSDRG
jgi:hypothetical protein